MPMTVFSVIRKAFRYESGALILAGMIPGYGLRELLEVVFSDVDMKSFAMPIISFGILIILYIMISLADFWTGTRASRKEHIISSGSVRGYIKSDKLWSSIWKFMAVIFIGFSLMTVCLLFVLIGVEWLHNFFQWLEIIFFIVVIGFDIHSIGENQLRRFGRKPAFYDFIDELMAGLRKGVIDKVAKIFT